jgi:hypothetical protein
MGTGASSPRRITRRGLCAASAAALAAPLAAACGGAPGNGSAPAGAAGAPADAERLVQRQPPGPGGAGLCPDGQRVPAYDAAAVQVKAILLPPRLSEIDKLIQDAYVRVLGGQASARQAMTEIKPQVDAILGAAGR